MTEPNVTTAMQCAGMAEWDRQMKAGERQWPRMLAAVYKAMHKAARNRKQRVQ